MAGLLAGNALNTALARTPWWTLKGGHIERSFKFGGFPAAIDFVNRVAEAAETANHHPDIDIRWNKVTLRLSTHSAGGLTPLDFDLAAECDRLAGNLSPPN